MSIDERYPDLQHPDPSVRQRIMQQIAEEKDEDTIPQLIAVLNSSDAAYRRSAIQTLGVIGDDAIPALLERLANDSNDTVRASCSQALVSIAHNSPEDNLPTQLLEGLYQAINDPHPVVQLSAIGGLSTLGTSAYELLVKALEIDNLAVGVAVINAIGSLGDRRGLQLLSTMSQDATADPYIRESATSAMSRLEQVIKFNS